MNKIELEPKTLTTTIEVSKYAVSEMPKQIVIEIGKYERADNELLRYRPLGRILVDESKDAEKYNEYLNHLENGTKDVLFSQILAEYNTSK